MSDVFTVCSLVGGGARGCLQPTHLERIEDACPGFVASVDL